MKPDSIDWKNIPDTISKNSFCKICHMSKRTASLYLGTDVPCADNGKTTHRYAIAKADIIDFLERTPERKGGQNGSLLFAAAKRLSAKAR